MARDKTTALELRLATANTRVTDLEVQVADLLQKLARKDERLQIAEAGAEAARKSTDKLKELLAQSETAAARLQGQLDRIELQERQALAPTETVSRTRVTEHVPNPFQHVGVFLPGESDGDTAGYYSRKREREKHWSTL